jgi:hypothetical protein
LWKFRGRSFRTWENVGKRETWIKREIFQKGM